MEWRFNHRSEDLVTLLRIMSHQRVVKEQNLVQLSWVVTIQKNQKVYLFGDLFQLAKVNLPRCLLRPTAAAANRPQRPMGKEG